MRASIVAIGVSLAVELAAVRARGTEADAGAPSADRDADSAAEQAAAEGYDLHAAGRFAEAIAAYLRAYDLSNASVALLNVATIYDRRLHEPALAAEYYRRYVAAPDADPGLLAKAAARLSAIERQRETADASTSDGEGNRDAAAATPVLVAPSPAASDAPTPPAASISGPSSSSGAPPAPAGTGGSWKTVGLVVGGAGVASVGASLVLGAFAMMKDRDADMMCTGSVCASEGGVRLAQESGRLATASTIVFFAGLALAGGGLTVVLTAPKSSASTAARGTAVSVTPALGRATAGLALHGGF